jgi:glycosyltransferase involved in cell wall biosynthesis
MTQRVAAVLPSLAGGGAERVMLTLLSGLDRAQFTTELVVFSGSGPLAALVPSGVTVHDLGCARLRQAAPGLLATLRRLRPSVIVSTLGYVNLALLAMKPFLPWQPCLILREANTPSRSLPTTPWPGLFRMAYRLLYLRADAVICPTKLIETELRDNFRVPAARLHVMPNPVDAVSIQKAAAVPRRRPGDGVRFVAAGRLTAQKGFDRLIEMLPALPDGSHVTIFGEGPEQANLETQAVRLGMQNRVTFAGFESNPWPYYAGADAFLLPSRWEGMPNAVLEALACGTPVIATPESGGIGELVDECPPGAVTIAETGGPFIAAMTRVRSAPCAAPRHSVLPSRFSADVVAGAFAALFTPASAKHAPPVRSR